MLGATYHSFTEAEVAAGGDDDLGSEIDLTYDFMPNKVLGIQIGFGQLSAGDAFGPDADSVTRFWSQVRARW